MEEKVGIIKRSQAYKRGESLVGGFARDHGGIEVLESNPSQAIEWMRTMASETENRETFMRYRQCVCLYLRQIGHESLSTILKGIEHKPQTSNLRDRIEVSKKKIGKRKPVKSEKGFMVSHLTSTDIEGLLAEMSRRKIGWDGNERGKYKHGIFLYFLFKLSCQTGLRPIEWYGASLVEGITDDSGIHYSRVLKVKNAEKGLIEKKRLYRHLALDAFSESEFEELKVFLSFLSESNDESMYRNALQACTQLMRKISKRLYGESGLIGLYAARHLFASETRREGLLRKQDLAAALGHTDIQNQAYYGDYESDAEPRQTQWALAKPIRSEALEVARYVEEHSYIRKMRLEAYKRSRAQRTKATPKVLDVEQ